MYVGKTLFAQVMEFVPWTSFARIVQRHGGKHGLHELMVALADVGGSPRSHDAGCNVRKLAVNALLTPAIVPIGEARASPTELAEDALGSGAEGRQ